MRLRVGVLLVVAVTSACMAKREDVTPLIAISPGAKGRLAVMDHFRHHGEVRRWLPRVTVEEVDDADLPLAESEDAPPASEDSALADAGATTP